MCTIPYSELGITTITSVALLDGEVNIDNLFYLLPITYLNLKKACYKKLPVCNILGAIISARYKGCFRGLPKNQKPFKNAIMIDLSMGNKNVAMKLSKTKIQLCGSTSRDMATFAGKIIVHYVLQIQKLLDRMYEDKVRTKRTMEWVLSQTRRPMMVDGVDVVALKPPEGYHACQPYLFPEGVDDTLARWFIPMMSDYHFHHQYEMHLTSYMFTIQRVMVPRSVANLPSDVAFATSGVTTSDTALVESLYPSGIRSLIPQGVKISMQNHNYSMGFSVHRRRLYDLFRRLDGWYAIYDSTWHTSVKIIKQSYLQKIKVKEGEDDEFFDQFHTWLIFSTGSVTQSGPHVTEIGEFYTEFNRIVNEHRDEVELKTRVRGYEQKVKVRHLNRVPLILPPLPCFDSRELIE
jgi:hypothetical protein